MSTLGWIALVLAALAVALVLWALPRRRRPAAASPRTVADLVRLRAAQAGSVEPPDVVAVPAPRAEVEEAPPAEPEAVVVAAQGVAPVRAAAPIRVSASADDTPWNRAARIAESDGVVWATDHDWPGRVDRPEPALRAVQLPAFPPELVDTRSTVPVVPAAAADGAVSDGGGEAVTRSAAVESVIAEPGIAVSVAAESGAAESGAAESAAAGTDLVLPVPGAAAAVGTNGVRPRDDAATPAVDPSTGEPAASPRPEAARTRLSAAEAAAEQAAADLALLRTFGCAPPAGPDDEPSTVSLEGACCVAAAPEAADGAAQPVAFRVVGRDGDGVPAAGVTLLDDHGKEVAGAVADAGGRGTVLAPRPGSYVLVSAAADHQPGAVAITVSAEPVSADLLLARSASLSGTVHGEDGPVVGARLTLVQDGEVVDTAQSGRGGAYRIPDLAAGEYGLSVTAAECEPATVVVVVPEESDLQHDVELDPEGLKRAADDMMIGLS